MSDQSSLCFFLCFIFVLLEFFFPENKHSTFVTILTEKQTDQVHLKEITFSSMSWTMIFELIQIIVEYTMIDAKVTSKLCFNWLLLLIFYKIKLTFLKSA